MIVCRSASVRPDHLCQRPAEFSGHRTFLGVNVCGNITYRDRLFLQGQI